MKSTGARFHGDVSTFLVIAPLLLTAILQLTPAPHQTAGRASISLTIEPHKATLFVGEKQKFAAAVKGATGIGIRWAVEEQEGGSISQGGVYTAPRIIGIYHITATSIANPRVKAVGTVTVVAYYDTPICVPRDP